jgi:hypothetical protein
MDTQQSYPQPAAGAVAFPIHFTPPRGKLAAALAKAQGEMRNPPKDRTVTIRPRDGAPYSYSYADLATIMDTVRAPLAKHGLAVTSRLEMNPSGSGPMLLHTALIHESGESVESLYPIMAGDAKTMGGAITYGRRYSISALLGIAADEDQDADDHAHPSEHGQRGASAPAPKPVPQKLAEALPVSKAAPKAPPREPVKNAEGVKEYRLTDGHGVEPPAGAASPEQQKKLVDACEVVLGITDPKEVGNLIEKVTGQRPKSLATVTKAQFVAVMGKINAVADGTADFDRSKMEFGEVQS